MSSICFGSSTEVNPPSRAINAFVYSEVNFHKYILCKKIVFDNFVLFPSKGKIDNKRKFFFYLFGFFLILVFCAVIFSLHFQSR